MHPKGVGSRRVLAQKGDAVNHPDQVVAAAEALAAPGEM